VTRVPPTTASLSRTRSTRVDFVARLAEHGDRVALVQDEPATGAVRALTYRELAARVEQEAQSLSSPHGGRRLLMLAPDRSIEAVTTYLGGIAAGHVALLAPDHDTDAQRELIARYDPDVVARRVGSLWQVTPTRPASAHTLHPDLALLLGTSGSTGSPKLVRLSAENLQANADSIVEALSITSDQRAVSTLPLTYSYGLSVLHSHLNVGASLLLTEQSVVDARFWDLMSIHEVTSLPAVPYTFELLGRVGFERQQLPRLAHVTVAGGRLAPDRVRHFAELGVRRGFALHVMYGQTEATARITTLDPALAAAHPDSIGRPVPGGSIDVVDVEADQAGVGEIVYRGPNVMLGYADSPAELALGRTIDALHTGDLAVKDPDGTFRIIGRRSRITKVFGLRIDLDRVEQVLADEGIAASVTGDDTTLCVVAEGRVHEAHVADRAARASGLPIHVVHARVIDRLPRLGNGKLDRAATECDCSTAPGEPLSPDLSHEAGAAPSAARIAALYARLLGRPDATVDDSFVALGGDSLSFVEVSVRVEALLGRLPADWHLQTPVQLAAAESVSHRRTAQLDTGVVLRAVAITAIVGTHLGLFQLLGGAHVLLGLAGFSMARFLLDPRDRSARTPKIVRSALRIAIPSVLWIGLLAALTAQYTWKNTVLLGTVLGPSKWGPAWHFWFIEALVLYLMVSAALFAIPAFDRWERAQPFWVPAALVAVGMLVRFGVMPGLADPRPFPAPSVYYFWFFALGWWAARARATWQRLLVSAVIVASVPGYWGSTWREGVVLVGLLTLTWFSSIRVPRVSVPMLTQVAAASLAIYLSHWVVYPPLRDVPVLAFVACLAVGVALYAASRLAMNAAKSFSFWSAYASPYSTRARSARSPLPR
jgi:acyl-CoA synthetase (AMP-forming)/AMP-acid ligase II